MKFYAEFFGTFFRDFRAGHVINRFFVNFIVIRSILGSKDVNFFAGCQHPTFSSWSRDTQFFTNFKVTRSIWGSKDANFFAYTVFIISARE